MEDEKRELDAARVDSEADRAEAGTGVSDAKVEVFGEPAERDEVKREQIQADVKPAESSEKKPSETNGQSGQGEQDGQGGQDENGVSAIGEWLELVLRAAVWALILYLFFFQVSVVDGPSMQPNFATNDRLVIDKLTYRFSSIRRFDVVVFQAVDMDHNVVEVYKTWSWKNWSVSEEHKMVSRESKDYIKRVIGLPGDKVEVKGCNVFINGKPLNEPEQIKTGTCYFSGPEAFIVPPKHYFVLGDNRGDSKDSRAAGLGFIPESQIRGIARLRFMPLDRWQWFSRQ